MGGVHRRQLIIYGSGIDEPICMINVSDGNLVYYCYHFNGLCSVVALTDEDGLMVEKYKYYVFGKPNICEPNGVPRASSIGNPHMEAAASVLHS